MLDIRFIIQDQFTAGSRNLAVAQIFRMDKGEITTEFIGQQVAQYMMVDVIRQPVRHRQTGIGIPVNIRFSLNCSDRPQQSNVRNPAPSLKDETGTAHTGTIIR